MGYRSNVRCVIYGEPDKVDKFVVKKKLEHSPGLEIFEPYTTYGQIMVSAINAGPSNEVRWSYISFDIQDVKWYADDEGVCAFMDMLGEVEGHDLNMEYIRVGDEDDDIDRRQSGANLQWFLSVERIIHCTIKESEDGEQSNDGDAEGQGENADEARVLRDAGDVDADRA